MNPFTHSLLKELDDPELRAWVRRWDQLEALVIAIYRAERAEVDQARHYRRLKAELADAYPDWETALAAYWPGLLAGGDPVRQDPFAALLAAREAREFVGNWRAMQLLPAAREALNAYLIDRLGGPPGHSSGRGPSPGEYNAQQS